MIACVGSTRCWIAVALLAGCTSPVTWAGANAERYEPAEPVPFTIEPGAGGRVTLVLARTPQRAELRIQDVDASVPVQVQGDWVYVPVLAADGTKQTRLYWRRWHDRRGLLLQTDGTVMARVVKFQPHYAHRAPAYATPLADGRYMPVPFEGGTEIAGVEPVLDADGKWLGWVVHTWRGMTLEADPTLATMSHRGWPKLTRITAPDGREFFAGERSERECQLIPVDGIDDPAWRRYEHKASTCAKAVEALAHRAEDVAARTADRARIAAEDAAMTASRPPRVDKQRAAAGATQRAEIPAVLSPTEVTRLKELRELRWKAEDQLVRYQEDIAHPPAGSTNTWGAIQSAVYSAEGTYRQPFDVAVRIYVMGKRNYDDWRALEERLRKAKAEGKPIPDGLD